MFRMPAPRTSAEITAKPDCRSALFQGPSLQCPGTARAPFFCFILVVLGAEVTLIIPSSHTLNPCNIMQSTHPFIHYSHAISYHIPLKNILWLLGRTQSAVIYSRHWQISVHNTKGTILLRQHWHHPPTCDRRPKCAEGQEIPGLTTIHQLTKRPAHLPSSPVASDVQNARHRLESAIWAWRDPFPSHRSRDWFTIRTSKLCIFV